MVWPDVRLNAGVECTTLTGSYSPSQKLFHHLLTLFFKNPGNSQLPAAQTSWCGVFVPTNVHFLLQTTTHSVPVMNVLKNFGCTRRHNSCIKQETVLVFCVPEIHLSIPFVNVFLWNLEVNVAIPLTFRTQYDSNQCSAEQLILLYRNGNVEKLKQKRVVKKQY